jgi:hypothetical protein
MISLEKRILCFFLCGINGFFPQNHRFLVEKDISNSFSQLLRPSKSVVKMYVVYVKFDALFNDILTLNKWEFWDLPFPSLNFFNSRKGKLIFENLFFFQHIGECLLFRMGAEKEPSDSTKLALPQYFYIWRRGVL